MPQTDAAFYFDLASPLAYLAAEQVLQLLPIGARWHPVLERDLTGAISGPGGPFRCASEQEISRSEIERQARGLGLQPLRWPTDFPFDSESAMCVATYAKSIGRVVPFAQAAFRQAFAGAHSLADINFVLIAAAACEMHPRAVLQSTERASVREELLSATALARSAGVRSVPTFRIGERLFDGEQALQLASSYALEIGSRQ